MFHAPLIRNLTLAVTAALLPVLSAMAQAPQASEPPPGVPKPELALPPGSGAAPGGLPSNPEVTALRNEIADLRDDLKMLKGSLDVMLNQIMADLREENAVLREEVRRLHQQRADMGLPDLTLIPRPGGAFIDEVLGGEEEEPPPPPPFEFTIVKEWGRDPEAAHDSGGGAATLKGMVGVVPRGSLREDVEALGRDLRKQYDAYDNINIEVFDDPVAARQFADTQKGDPDSRVLSVSRHKASGRDTILYLDKGKASEVGNGGPEPGTVLDKP